jgi:hypothetical protein
MSTLKEIQENVRWGGGPAADDVMRLLEFAEMVAAQVDSIDWHEDASINMAIGSIYTEVNDLRNGA